MCGRFSLISDLSELQLRFDFENPLTDYVPRFNISPTQDVLTVRWEDGHNVGEYMRWGLIPSWAKDMSIGNRAINARAETLAERPMFRTALRRRRCLILADGFYEWTGKGKARQPMRILLATGEPFAFAGLWENWTNPEGEQINSCTIVTTTPNDLMRPIHDRMPVILPSEHERTWVDETTYDAAVLNDILIPYPPVTMEAYPVSTLVNSPANDTPEVIVRAG
ncbi:MAG: SOS response-associated peptidase [Dehalococcoidia bacterium]|nr:SOS response-associated peptidase [Dehalococcoidia bacterium]